MSRIKIFRYKNKIFLYYRRPSKLIYLTKSTNKKIRFKWWETPQSSEYTYEQRVQKIWCTYEQMVQKIWYTYEQMVQKYGILMSKCKKQLSLKIVVSPTI